MSRAPGFTLVEAIVAITITGILGAVVAVFLKNPIDAYIDTVRRAELTDAADTALRRIERDVRAALPNSLRTTSPASSGCFEFLPVIGGGRYRVSPKSDGTGDVLDFTATDTSFDVVAGSNLPASFAAAETQHVVIYNLGISGADAYAGDTRAAIDTSATSTATSARIVLGTGKQFPFDSPGRRFQVVPDSSVVYSCSGGNLYRGTRSLSSALMASCPTTGTVLVGNVSTCSFSYTPAASQRNGLLTMTLVLTDAAGESVRLYHEVHVNDVP